MQKVIIECRIPTFNNIKLPNSKIRSLYKSTDAPAGLSTDSQPDADGLSNFYRPLPKLTVWVC
jgi:hypothetical protein